MVQWHEGFCSSVEWIAFHFHFSFSFMFRRLFPRSTQLVFIINGDNEDNGAGGDSLGSWKTDTTMRWENPKSETRQKKDYQPLPPLSYMTKRRVRTNRCNMRWNRSSSKNDDNNKKSNYKKLLWNRQSTLLLHTACIDGQRCGNVSDGARAFRSSRASLLLLRLAQAAPLSTCF